MISNPLLNGDRLSLRKIASSDVTETYLNWMNDNEVTRHLESRFQKYSIQNLKEYVINLEEDQNNFLFAIIIKKNQRHIGNIKLGPINRIHLFAEIGLLIGEKDCWGKGYASEAIELICHFAFSYLNLNKLTAGCYQTNIGSLKAFQKTGFIVEGVINKQYLSDGKYIDGIRLGLLNRNST